MKTTNGMTGLETMKTVLAWLEAGLEIEEKMIGAGEYNWMPPSGGYINIAIGDNKPQWEFRVKPKVPRMGVTSDWINYARRDVISLNAYSSDRVEFVEATPEVLEALKAAGIINE